MNTHALVLSFTLAVASTAHADDPGTQYKLAAGDVLRIIVFGEPELSLKKIRLSDAGTFSYPFLGEISAKG